MTWPNREIIDLFGIELPIIQAPMAGANGSAMAIAVSEAGGMGSLPCAMLDADGIRREVDTIRAHTSKPINLNFFCHKPTKHDTAREQAWLARLASYYAELELDNEPLSSAAERKPFDEQLCEVVEQLKPEVVSFHFDLPAPSLLNRVKSAGCLILSSATTVGEALWLQDQGCDAIIAQGYEAGGHRGMFLVDDLATQIGIFALLPQIVSAVTVPVIAAGGIVDGCGISAAFMLGATGVQIGTAFLASEESPANKEWKEAIIGCGDAGTALMPRGRMTFRTIINDKMTELMASGADITKE